MCVYVYIDSGLVELRIQTAYARKHSINRLHYY